MSHEQQLQDLCQGVFELIDAPSLLAKLKRKQRLRIKAGFDPTSADLHLGHSVLLHKLRQFQEWGHEVLLLVGDFTARIGDPTGRNQTRSPLDPQEIAHNAKTYQEQAFCILDPEKTQVVYNSEWLAALSVADMIHLQANMTVARMLERDDFTKRFTSHQPIALHEFVYPILQAYDSVVLKADVEVGGTDQKFNLLLGRDYQRMMGQEEQVVLLMPLVEGTDGQRKMSKSYGNAIAIMQDPKEMYGQIMSIPDALIERYYELLTPVDQHARRAIHEALAGGDNPRDHKTHLASTIVALYYDQQAADKAKQAFIAQFSQKKVPDDIRSVTLSREWQVLPLSALLKNLALVKSTSEANRLLSQGAIKIDGEKASDADVSYTHGMVIQVGKRRFVRLLLPS